ncbi:MAG: hypothetical protein WBV99_20230 [Candidatus Binatus sp.]|jgi:hypothetical protein
MNIHMVDQLTHKVTVRALASASSLLGRAGVQGSLVMSQHSARSLVD